MKITMLFFCFLMYIGAFAANYDWTNVRIVNGEIGGSSVRLYDVYGHVGKNSTEGPLLGYQDEHGFYLKQSDHMTTSVHVDNNVWVLAYYGELLSHEAIEAATRIPLVDWCDAEPVGGVLVETPSDFYLGFMSTGSNAYDGIDRFGWYHVSLDANLDMALLDAGIGLDGESVLVGIGPIPEPTGSILVLCGLAVLGLRRKETAIFVK